MHTPIFHNGKGTRIVAPPRQATVSMYVPQLVLKTVSAEPQVDAAQSIRPMEPDDYGNDTLSFTRKASAGSRKRCEPLTSPIGGSSHHIARPSLQWQYPDVSSFI
ncbi:hypothetical protein BV25DRAFT_915589 [Artomyces pyxidatus]|uniref:Uncharacterized protein n=2 Tax=Artomyces pyxidatus TaxID=48021 RepID=A0ACB8SDD2_9AGAM|nr:hypothetical protein BV25DRAFT_967039 [Artomyces pyxidatus]KAI0054344.1 hypothetical protein BV25DRAFT_915589 [Artomyces pyxidatus]